MKDAVESIKIMQERGFVLLPQSISVQELSFIDNALAELDIDVRAAGQRNLLNRLPGVNALAAHGDPHKIACQILAGLARPVRAILFDKTPQANWYVTWHQDLTIPVKKKADTDGFTSWSVKEDIVHVQPPAEVLEHMVSLRLHLDDCGAGNGPIKFLAGSHREGILDVPQIAGLREKVPESVCTAARGDIIAMRPLILHASSQATSPARRRVLHLEYTTAELPAGLEWAQA